MLSNRTPHAITICNSAGDEIIRTIPPEGDIDPVAGKIISARVSSFPVAGADIDGVPFAETVFGEVVGLPAPDGETVFIVSDFVLRAAIAENPTRTDLVRPDTGPTCVRKDGQIWAVKGLTR